MSAGLAMAERRRGKAPRSYAASRLDEVTLAIVVALLSLTVGAVLKLGPDEALGRIASGLSSTVSGFRECWQSCR